jgi:hypothetical protein
LQNASPPSRQQDHNDDNYKLAHTIHATAKSRSLLPENQKSSTTNMRIQLTEFNENWQF